MRTTSGSTRRCAAVPVATPAMSRPVRGRASGGRGGAAAGAGGGGGGTPRTSPPPPPRPPRATPPPFQGPPPPPPPPGPPVRGQLRRSTTDKVIGGVAGGLARYSGIDPLLWRVGFVALAFAGGTGVLVSLLLWLLMPAT